MGLRATLRAGVGLFCLPHISETTGWICKIKQRSIALSIFRGKSNFIDLGVTDDVTGQVKNKMFNKNKLFTGLLGNAI